VSITRLRAEDYFSDEVDDGVDSSEEGRGDSGGIQGSNPTLPSTYVLEPGRRRTPIPARRMTEGESRAAREHLASRERGRRDIARLLREVGFPGGLGRGDSPSLMMSEHDSADLMTTGGGSSSWHTDPELRSGFY